MSPSPYLLFNFWFYKSETRTKELWLWDELACLPAARLSSSFLPTQPLEPLTRQQVLFVMSLTGVGLGNGASSSPGVRLDVGCWVSIYLAAACSLLELPAPRESERPLFCLFPSWPLSLLKEMPEQWTVRCIQRFLPCVTFSHWQLSSNLKILWALRIENRFPDAAPVEHQSAVAG